MVSQSLHRSFAIALRRIWMQAVCSVVCVLACLPSVAYAQVVNLAVPQVRTVLPTVVNAFHLPLAETFDPQAIWSANQAVAQAANPQGRWDVSSAHATAAKFTLTTQAEHIFSVEVPLVRMDKVQLFWRTPGSAWRHAEAGDTVPLSRWPIVGQFATFLLHFDPAPSTLDVLLVMQNTGAGNTAVYLNSDRESREGRLLQANAAGLLIGASAMALVINLLLLGLYRSKATLYLLIYCAAVTLGIAVLSGYAAIWFTPEWPRLNDSAKPFVTSLVSAAMLLASLAALDRNVLSAWARRLGAALAISILLYGLAQAAWLAPSWRLVGGVAGAGLAVLMVVAASLASWRRGDRYAPWVIIAALLFAGSAVVVSMGYVQVAGQDVFSLAMAFLSISSNLVLRHVLVLRERFGRAVIGRAETNRFRDPLTALLTYEGFERAVDNLAVRQHSGGGIAKVLYFSLAELNNFKNQDGYVVWQRDLVRFAAVLQKALGEGWHIARLSNSKFGAVRLDDHQNTSSGPLLTLVLSSCVRMIDTYGWVDRVDLRMAAVVTPLTGSGLQDSLRVLEDSVQSLDYGKRIILL
jgi:two-component system, sensor histidine kinase LadS